MGHKEKKKIQTREAGRERRVQGHFLLGSARSPGKGRKKGSVFLPRARALCHRRKAGIHCHGEPERGEGGRVCVSVCVRVCVCVGECGL